MKPGKIHIEELVLDDHVPCPLGAVEHDDVEVRPRFDWERGGQGSKHGRRRWRVMAPISLCFVFNPRGDQTDTHPPTHRGSGSAGIGVDRGPHIDLFDGLFRGSFLAVCLGNRVRGHYRLRGLTFFRGRVFKRTSVATWGA